MNSSRLPLASANLKRVADVRHAAPLQGMSDSASHTFEIPLRFLSHPSSRLFVRPMFVDSSREAARYESRSLRMNDSIE